MYKMLRVGFDISQTAFGGGVATYTNNITSELNKLSDLEMVFFYSSLRKKYLGNLKNVKNFHLPPTILEVFFNRIRNIPIERFIGPVDVYHSSDWLQPKTKAKKVTTYHDIVPLKFPDWSHPKIVEVHKKRLKLVEEEIDAVIAVSESTKKDLLEITNIPEKKIVVIYEAPGENFRRCSEKMVEDFRKKRNLPGKFVLAIGGIGKRRNMDRVNEACRGYPLIVAGVDIPHLSDEEMPLLYESSTVLLYPSLYEGFGLPILEAFACATPVITSNVSSMPEIAGGAALLVNPLDVAEMKNSLKMVMEDKRTRDDLVKKGLRRAGEFSWKKAAKETAQVYKRLLNQKE